MHTYAKVLITNNEGKILCLFRAANHPEYPKHPDLPGGEVEGGEEPVDAAIREIKEETNLDLLSSSLKLVYSKQTDIPQVNIIFTAKIDEKDPKIVLGWEHERYKWVTTAWLQNIEIDGKIDDYFLSLREYLKTASI